jgi:hypothetical protein
MSSVGRYRRRATCVRGDSMINAGILNDDMVLATPHGPATARSWPPGHGDATVMFEKRTATPS